MFMLKTVHHISVIAWFTSMCRGLLLFSVPANLTHLQQRMTECNLIPRCLIPNSLCNAVMKGPDSWWLLNKLSIWFESSCADNKQLNMAAFNTEGYHNNMFIDSASSVVMVSFVMSLVPACNSVQRHAYALACRSHSPHVNGMQPPHCLLSI